MQLRIMVILGFWVLNIISISKTNPINRTPSAITTVQPYGVAATSPANSGRHISERDEWIANLGNGWAGYFETWESCIPVQLASSVLTHFYSSILDRVQSSASSLGDPLVFQAFEWDNLRLEFSSDANKIPWEFIATFAARMAASTQRGFTGQFNAVYVHMATEQSIRISLMVLGNAARFGRMGQNY